MREKRRQLLELKKRGKARARTLMYHVATESDVLEILTDFTIDFLLKVIIHSHMSSRTLNFLMSQILFYYYFFIIFFFFRATSRYRQTSIRLLLVVGALIRPSSNIRQ